MWMAMVLAGAAAGTARAQSNPGLSTKPAMRTIGEKLPDKNVTAPADLPPLNVPTEEMKLYGEAAKNGEAWAQTRLAMLLLSSFNDRNNTDEAVRLLRAAAEQNDAEALFQLAVLSSQGRGMPLSDEAAFAYMSKSAELGWAEAQYELATMYANGRGTLLDKQTALKWARRAADQGNAPAQYELARVMIQSAEKEKKQEAIDFLTKAANGGHVEALLFLATILGRGDHGLAKDEARAESLLLPCAKKGNADCQFVLAALYKHGDSFTERRQEAQIWLQRAAIGGNRRAREILNEETSNTDG